MVAFKLEADGGVDALKSIKDRIQRMKNLKPALDASATAIRKLMDDSFRGSMTPEAKQWPPLSAATIAGRKKKSIKPLVDTGVLKNSMTAVVEGDSIVFGTNVPYAAAQNFGAEINGVYGTSRKKKAAAGGGLRATAASKPRKRKKKRSGMLGPMTVAQEGRRRDGREARKGGAYTIVIPARAFIPWDPVRDDFMVYGPAGETITKIYKYITGYIETGSVPRL